MSKNTNTAEKDFYLKHSKEIVDFPDFDTDLNEIFLKFFD